MSPGPGTYDGRNNRYINLSYTIPDGERMSPMSRDQRLNPGPGNYETIKPFGNGTIKVSSIIDLLIFDSILLVLAVPIVLTKIN